MSVVQALWLAVLQGVSELFPISSIGHTVLIPRLIGWDLDQQSPTFLPFLVALHLGTASALLCFFWRDWLAIVVAPIRMSGWAGCWCSGRFPPRCWGSSSKAG